MATTIIDIAKAAGVGEATVVRALRGTGYVSPATKARVTKAAAELKYRPNHIARSLVLGKSVFIGIVANSGQVAGIHPFIEPMEQAIREAGYSLLFYISTGMQPDADRTCLEDLMNKRVPGAIVIPGSLSPDPKPYKEALDAGVKLVILDKIVDGLKAPQLIPDNYKSGRIATEHLISLGHRNIAYLAVPQRSDTGRERARGFRDALTAAGIDLSESRIIEVEKSEADGAHAVTQLLKQKKRPTAVLARHDDVAIGVMQAVFDAGLSIPNDLSLVSHGDSGPAYALRVPLTTIHGPEERMTKQGTQMLLDMLNGRDIAPEVNLLDVYLSIRSSTAPPPSIR